MLIAATIAASLLLLVVSSASLVAVSAGEWVIFGGMIVAVQTSLHRGFAEAALTMLVVAWAADLMASGPPGVHGLVLTLMFFVVYSLSQRVGGRYLLASFALTTGGSLALALAEALLVSLVYTDTTPLALFGVHAFPSALLTGLVAIPYVMLMSILERLWATRRERSIIVD